MLPFSVKKAFHPLKQRDKVMLLGSCFTENIGKKMQDMKMNVLENPHGVLFNPASITNSLKTYLNQQVYPIHELFPLNDIWNHWDFHSRFSHIDKDLALQQMNTSVEQASAFIRDADWLILTLGSSYQYFLLQEYAVGKKGDYGVANCHKAPGNWFAKRMLDIDNMVTGLNDMLYSLHELNPKLKIILTVSPVRHIKDGIVENNRSKARLLEVVHCLSNTLPFCSYFPAYELVIDVLRDYRFYEQDLVHPGIAAIQFVWERFLDAYIEEDDRVLFNKIEEVNKAKSHRLQFPDSFSAKKFKAAVLNKIRELELVFPYIDWKNEINYFSS